MIFTSTCGYQGKLNRADISKKSKSISGIKLAPIIDWSTSELNNQALVELYKEQIEQNQDVIDRIIEFESKNHMVLLCDCKEGQKCHKMYLAQYLSNKYNLTYGGEIGENDENLHQLLDKFEMIENIEYPMFDNEITSEAKVREKFESIWKDDSDKTLSDCLKEYEETSDHYKRSLDIPTPQALIDMACMDKGYLEIKTQTIRGSFDKCCKSQKGEKITNMAAGRMDQAHFTELCVSHRGRLYRLEEKSGRELPKYKDIQWLQQQIGCTLQEADEFNKAFIDLELGAKEVYSIIFGGSIDGKEKSGIKQTGNQYLQKFLDLQQEVQSFKLIDNFEQYSEIENIEGTFNDEFEIIEESFKESERFDSNLYSAKRLSIDEESLSEEEIAEIKYGSYEDYKEVLKVYMKPKYKFKGKDGNGKNIFVEVGKKINDVKTSSAVSMAWIYIKEAKAKFDSIKEAEMERELQEMPFYMADAIAQYVFNPSKQNKYRITTCVYGGEWDGERIPPANPIQKKICWKAIYG